MNYSDGKLIKIGDEVRLWENCVGKVVCCIDTNQFTDKYPKSEWEYLKKGVLIFTEKNGLFHYDKTDKDLKLLKRDVK